MSDEVRPFAWAVIGDDYEYATLLAEHAGAVAEEEGGRVVPLYRQPHPALTDAERTLICRLAAACEGGHPREWTNRALTADDRATLRDLLERLK